jgi:hypothetical protein
VITLSKAEERVEQWSGNRGILDQSTCEKQMLKFKEERLEMMDAIGDQAVCLINAKLLGLSLAEYDEGIGSLIEACNSTGVEFDECLSMAIDVIKKRAGLMVDGLYVKWANLTHPQRVEAAKKGQLLEPDVDVSFCRSCCTDYEWSEIRAAEQSALDS